MIRVAILVLLIALSSGIAHAGSKQRLTIVDYFLRLPPKYFEDTPEGILSFLKQPRCGVVDVKNGYISCVGDGAQPEFEAVLFRYRDDRPLLAVCSGELEGPNSVYLDFFELGPDNRMKEARRSIFPVRDAGNEKGAWRFELPRHGRTVLVRSQGTEKVRQKFAWNGERFEEEK
jgi:hypothetical protein